MPCSESRLTTAQPSAPMTRVGGALTGAYIARPVSAMPTPAPAQTTSASAQTQTATSLAARPADARTQSPPLPIVATPAAATAPAQGGAGGEGEFVELPTGRMLFSHAAEGEGEISVAAGTIVGLLDTSRDDWWNIVVGDQVRCRFVSV